MIIEQSANQIRIKCGSESETLIRCVHPLLTRSKIRPRVSLAGVKLAIGMRRAKDAVPVPVYPAFTTHIFRSARAPIIHQVFSN
jgi:hypothetical protein